MRVQGLNIALRPRSAWEAVDLGVALVRLHARAIFPAWLLFTFTAFVLLNALLVPFDLAWLAGLLLWWCKPVYDRIPLHVLSHAIMGHTPTLRETLRAASTDFRPLWPWLLWRRLHPSRSMLLAVDLLEHERGERRKERVRVLGASDGSTPALLWIIGAHLELMLWGSIIVFALMLVPTEFLSDSAEAMFEALFETPPWWMQVLNNGLYWVAMCVIEPVYVGAGFALYLNRRTQLEAWDIELAFRRIAARLGQAALLVLALVFACPSAAADDPARAAAETAAEAAAALEPGEAAKQAPLLSELFETANGEADKEFARAVKRALADPELSPKQTVGEWRWRDQSEDEATSTPMPPWAKALSGFVALVIENILWILLALALLVAAINYRRWLPWLVARSTPAPAPALSATQEQALPTPLPADLPAAVLALWQAGDTRAALSLFYRGALAALIERLGSPLPPGATEAECLRLARRVPGTSFAATFRRVVACWQRVAYAHRMPDEAELRELLDAWRDAERPA